MDIIRIFIDQKFQIQITGHFLIGIIILGIFILWFIYIKFIRKRLTRTFEINEIELGIGNNPNVKLKVNDEDISIAYKMWVELSTRKIGFPIDFENDVIIEVYNSWFECFGIVRELIKNIPVSKATEYKSTRNLIEISIDILNKGLRPHLTSWQAKFRKWYQQELEKEVNKEKSPQEIQKGFKDIDALVHDMRLVNAKLISYTQKLNEISLRSKKYKRR